MEGPPNADEDDVRVAAAEKAAKLLAVDTRELELKGLEEEGPSPTRVCDGDDETASKELEEWARGEEDRRRLLLAEVGWTEELRLLAAAVAGGAGGEGKLKSSRL